MKTKLFLIGLLIGILSGCLNDYESKKIISPSKKYKIKAIVNRTNSNSKDYAYVIINLYNKNDNLLNKINTGAGDFNKWHIGWTEKGDTILLQSSDIGNKAWIIKENNFVEIKMTNKINKMAEKMKENK